MRATDGDEPAVAKKLTDGHVPPDVLVMLIEDGYCLPMASGYSPYELPQCNQATATDGNKLAVTLSRFENVRLLTASDGGPSYSQARTRVTDGDEPAAARMPHVVFLLHFGMTVLFDWSPLPERRYAVGIVVL